MPALPQSALATHGSAGFGPTAAWQVPPVQVVPALHALHDAPPVPQALAEVPGWQTPF